MTLTQLKVFVLVARLGSVKAAAAALGVSEPAVSQALSALRQSLGDQLLERSGPTMELTAAGRRVVPIASQMVHLATEAEAAVRQSHGAPELLRVVATSTVGEVAAPALLQAFTTRVGNVEVELGIAQTGEMTALLVERLADVALGPLLDPHAVAPLVSEPLMRYRTVLVAGHAHPLAAEKRIRPERLRRQTWLVDPEGTDPRSYVGQLLARLAVAPERVRVFPNQASVCAAAADGAGVAAVVEHAMNRDPARQRLATLDVAELPPGLLWHVTSIAPDRRRPMVSRLHRFLRTPEAMHAMHSADGGVSPSRFKPPVYVTLWS